MGRRAVIRWARTVAVLAVGAIGAVGLAACGSAEGGDDPGRAALQATEATPPDAVEGTGPDDVPDRPPESTVVPDEEPGRAPSPDDDPAGALATARLRWAERAIGDHTLVVQDDCGECASTDAAITDVVVWNGDVYASGAEITVEGLYGTIERAIDEGRSVEATYDADTGHPTEVWIDREDRAADGGVHLIVHDLVEGLPGEGVSLERLLAARETWERARPDRYEYVVTIACGGCAYEGRLSTLVADGEVVDWSTEGVDRFDVDPLPIDELFDDLERLFTAPGGLEEGGVRFQGTAEYHPTFGYPTWIGLDIEVFQPDDYNTDLPQRVVYMVGGFEAR